MKNGVRPHFCAALLALAAACASQEQEAGNVALGKSFKCSSEPGIAWLGLLDGDKTSDEPPGCFATGPDAEYPKKIVIDLGAVYEIEQIAVYSSTNGNTRQAELWASRDGVTYDRMREPYTFPDKTAQRMSAKFPPREARYVKIALLDTYGGGLGGDHVLFLREVEVFGRPVAATAATRTRPTISGEPPRLARLFRRYVLKPEAQLRLLVIGDDSARGPEGGLAEALAAKLRERFSLGDVQVTARCEPGYTAQSASSYPVSLADEPPDLVVVALGTADALAFDAAAFRAAMEQLLRKLLDRTDGMIVVVAPPPIPNSPDLPRAQESASADTAEAAWQLASLVQGTEMAIVDAADALRKSGLDVPAAYEDNLSLSHAGHEAVAAAIVDLFR